MLNLVSRSGIGTLALVLALCAASAFAAGEPEIVLAAKQSNLKGLASLLASGADVNAATGDGSTALMWAAYNNQPDAVEDLLKAGADPNAVTDLGVSALWNAAINGNDEITAQLLEAGANPNLAMIAGETPLMAAARGGFPEVAQLLIDARRDAQQSGHPRPNRADVGRGEQASRGHQGTGGRGRGHPHSLGFLERDDGRSAARASRIQPLHPARE